MSIRTSAVDFCVHVALSVILIVGIYRFYFWCQRNHAAKARSLRLRVDDLLPYRPAWVWIYSFLYYPIIPYTNWNLEDSRRFVHVAGSFVLLPALHMLFFVLFPVAIPPAWRARPPARGRSERFLTFVQRFDQSTNCFPSMHTSVAMLTALHLAPALGLGVIAFPVLISLSCVYTKSHFVLDLPPGILLGWAVYGEYGMMRS
jgi:hypothetical protein